MDTGPDNTNNGAVIELRDVRKIYRMGTEQVHALAGVSVSFEPWGPAVRAKAPCSISWGAWTG